LYDASAPEFQPGADERRQPAARGRPSRLEQGPVLQLPPAALRGEQRAHEATAGLLGQPEPLARREPEREWERGEEQMA
jgi:hypothetical protein